MLNQDLITNYLLQGTTLWTTLLALAMLTGYFWIKDLKVKTVIILSIIAIFSLLVLRNFERLENRNYTEQQRLEAFRTLSEIRSKVEFQLLADVKLAEVFALFVEANDYEYTTDEFNAISNSIISATDHISHIASAPGLIIHNVYPLEPNKGAMGLNYRENPVQMPAVQYAIDKRGSVLDGPITLVQGGRAFVVRVPIFFSGAHPKEGELWGIVTTVVYADALFESSGLNEFPDWKIAIRNLKLSGDQAVFFGNSALFAESSGALLQEMIHPSFQWEIALEPISGWNVLAPEVITVRWLMFGIYLLVAAFVIVRARQHILQDNMTQQLINETRQRKRSETRYRELFENSNNGIALINDNQIVDCNYQLENMLGMSRKKVIGKAWYTVFNEEQNEEAAESYYRRTIEQLDNHNSFTVDWSHHLPEGEQYLEITFTRLDKVKKGTILVTCRDITVRKQLEVEQQKLNQQLKHAHKMEAIGQLTGGIAHDFNNILAAINGYAQLAKAMLAKEPSVEHISHYMEEVIKGGNRAKQLVQQMLAFGRGSEVTIKPVSPYKIAVETLKMMQATIPSSIYIETNYMDTTSKIASDPIQLQQVMLNLIVNARDAIKDQVGEIHINLTRTELSPHTCESCHEGFSGEFIEFSIEDTGVGIDKEMLHQVFQPFFSTKAVGEGSGMGLSVVHGIVHSGGGHILMQSTPNVGTKIRLLFPAIDESEDELSLEVIDFQEQQPLEGLVMLVDDEEPITKLLSNIIKETGLDVISFNDSEEALSYFLAHHQDVSMLLTDQTMPKLTGAELVKKVRSYNKDMPIILCTGFSDVINEDVAMSIGVNVYLEKPVDMSLLTRQIRELLSTTESPA